MYAKYVKRILDIVLSVIVLVVFAIPSLVIAILIKVTSRGPVFFSQDRCGRDNRPFMFYKFRTMAADTPQLATREFKDADSYITPVGGVLRKLSLDELPQAWNVLRGDMSIVGPRPVIFKEKALIRRRTENGANQLRPGITGWAQVRGRDLVGPAKKAKLDAEYKERLSFIFDVYCLFMTVWTVVSFHGHAEGHSDKHENVIDEELRATTQ